MDMIVTLLAFIVLQSQPVFSDFSNETSKLVFPQKTQMHEFQQSGLDFLYFNDAEIRSLANVPLTKHERYTHLACTKSGKYYAATYKKGNAYRLAVYSCIDAKSKAATIKLGKTEPLSICFSSDGRKIYVLLSDGVVNVVSVKAKNKDHVNSITLLCSFSLDFICKSMLLGNNDSLLACYNDNMTEIINTSTLKPQHIIPIGDSICDVKFSDSGKYLAILASSGLCLFYDTNTFSIFNIFNTQQQVKSLGIHPHDTYFAVSDNEGGITIINMFNPEDRQKIHTDKGTTSFVSFYEDLKKTAYLVYEEDKQVVFNPLSFLSPNMMSVLKEELNFRMKEWEKRLPFESLDEYNLRMNSESRLEQIRLFETQIATEMAGNMLEMTEIRLGSYNAQTNMLTLEFDNLSNIYIPVPQNQIIDFVDNQNLVFENTKYYLTQENTFEVAYTEVTNTITGKKYVFNNLSRDSLDFIKGDENFMPLSIMRNSYLEEIKLNELKDDIVNQARNNQFISDNTQISVKTNVLPVYENGDSRLDYQVSIDYTVSEKYSSHDDFKPGQYDADHSNASVSMLRIMEKALLADFAKYFVPGKIVKVRISGSADALKINGKISYDGKLGSFIDVPVIVSGDPVLMTVTEKTGIASNEQLAFMRAMSLKEYLKKKIWPLENMDVEYVIDLKVSSETGSEYRRIGIELIFVDAF